MSKGCFENCTRNSSSVSLVPLGIIHIYYICIFKSVQKVFFFDSLHLQEKFSKMLLQKVFDIFLYFWKKRTWIVNPLSPAYGFENIDNHRWPRNTGIISLFYSIISTTGKLRDRIYPSFYVWDSWFFPYFNSSFQVCRWDVTILMFELAEGVITVHCCC